MFDREVDILRTLSHSNVVRFVDVMKDSCHMYLIMEKCSGGEVFEKLLQVKVFPEQEAVDLFAQVLHAIEYIHSLNIIHRDVKAENFLYSSDGTVKLIDFGLSVQLKTDTEYLSAVVGSVHYLAPEMIRQRYSKPVDLWSAGIMFYLLLFGRYPYEGSEENVMNQIKHHSPKWKHERLSTSALNFLQTLLERDPRKRATATAALSHPFICSSDRTTQADEDEGSEENQEWCMIAGQNVSGNTPRLQIYTDPIETCNFNL